MKKLMSLLLVIAMFVTMATPISAKTEIKINKSKAVLEVDATLKLKISGTDSKATWSTNKKSVATVSKAGTITAKAEGEAIVSAKVNGKKFTCNVTVVDSNKPLPKKEIPEVKLYGKGDTWTVDSLWSLTFDVVYSTSYRNQFSNLKPAQVITLEYTYENIGYDGDIMDLYISSSSMKVVDKNNEIASTYPGNIDIYPKDIPVGTKCVGAQQVYGLNNESVFITVYVEMRDTNLVKHEATFYLAVLPEELK